MLFNSYEFLYLFLPATLAGFFLLGRGSRTWGLRWLIVASLFFYAWWRPINILIIAPSILINFFLARMLVQLRAPQRHGAAQTVLVLGIVFNIAFLGYFKYANFFMGTANDLFGAGLVFTRIILPLGISFITFQKIAFLIDVHAGRVEGFTLQDYCLFVLFFPQLIAGPIVHYREMMPQFQRATCRMDPENVAVGVTLLAFGLFKKVVLADRIAPLVASLYSGAAAGNHYSLLPAWMAAVGFTFQIYFDFSGYTDMALGLARFVGVRFPPNFNSPLKASSIIDFWLRWHMTLTRFLTGYVYNPLVLWLTRRRMAKGRASLGGRNATISAFVSLLVMPTILTMVVSGFWHGAGYLFILWGFVHGVYLTINHAWRRAGPQLWRDKASYQRFMKPMGWVLTFGSVAAAMVLFRSSSVPAALSLLKGMIGLNGLALPAVLHEAIPHLPSWVRVAQGGQDLSSYGDFKLLTIWIVLLGIVALALPNTLQLLARYEPALGFATPADDRAPVAKWPLWSPSAGWAIVVSVIAAFGIVNLGGKSEFLYWQF